ncbi:MAG TPA: hypothetical protein PKC43_12745 [Phycisphaerales bacterium]|nr:hypothetical protein [Phycisphaerales bacterium]HMP38301.1 hypothetical protein [Phycisphaerales bacterium]
MNRRQLHRSIRRRAGLAALGAAGVLGSANVACTPRATFPPTPGTQSVEPWVAPIPEVMATSLRYTRTRHAPNEPMVFNLPPNVPEWIWNNVQGRLGEDARPMMPSDRVAFEVTEVRIDGARAEVDVIYPAGGDLFQLITVGLTTDPFQSWRPTFERRWRIPTSRPVSNWGLWVVREDTDFPPVNPQPWQERQ